MNLQHSFQVKSVTNDIYLLLKNAFLPSFSAFSKITPGTLEMDFMIREDGSLCLNRITSTNADLYSYFRYKLSSLQLNGAPVEYDRIYTLHFSVKPGY
jgi:hypothetical protein